MTTNGARYCEPHCLWTLWAADSKGVVWVGVPDDAVITEPNEAGRTMVWPVYGGHPNVWIRCFMPSSAAGLAYAGYFKVCR